MRAIRFCGVAVLTGLAVPLAAAPPPLIVCADPNNLPFSNRAGEGFENQLAVLIARDLGRELRYVWWAQRRGYIRNTLGEAACDMWPGIAAGIERVAATQVWYRSTYVFVSRADRPLAGLTLDDPRLRTSTIGVQMIGDDAANTPPSHALSGRGIVENVRGYMLYGDYSQDNPAARIVDAVALSEVDVALVWGPFAGYYAGRAAVPLRIEPVTQRSDSDLPMTFGIAVGVRKDEPDLRAAIDTILTREGPAIQRLLVDYRVPQPAE